MKTVEDAQEDLARRWAEIEPSAATIESHPRQTLRPATEGGGARRAVEALSQLATRRGAVDADLSLGTTIGVGGMGVVRTGTQITMGRQVAVKTLREDVDLPERATLKLLQEAWVTGALEHPNVVPVYDVRLDGRGHPHILLKRIEGVAWSELFHDADEVGRRFGAEDLLEWNLGVFMQVCNAVHFAHSRGILHRDIKPDNVMIGEFGEVYLVDWGLAVSLRDDMEGRLPHASEARQLAGTPLYMAPEMLGGGGELTERTDVYLLGATLYELLASHPPHDGDTAMQILSKAAISEPPPPPAAPAALTRIALMAMSRSPSDRFGEADELRLAVQSYLRSRGSEQIAVAAVKRLAELEAIVSSSSATREGDSKPSARTSAEARQDFYRIHGEARFGFQQALEIWPGNEQARSGIARAAELIVDYELARGDSRAAEARLAELEQPPSALRERVHNAVTADAARVDALERLERDRDASTGARTRTFVAALAGVTWTVIPLLAELARTGGMVETYPRLFAASVGYLLGLGVITYWARESMLRTAINRQIVLAAATTFVAQIAFDIGALALGVDARTAIVLHLALWLVVAVLGLLTIDRRFAVATVGYAAAFFTAAAEPDLRFYAMAGANLILTANVIWLWKPLFTIMRSPEEPRVAADSAPSKPRAD